MRQRVAIVTTRYGGGWDEEELITRRFAGALACRADVDVLVAGGPDERVERDGAVRILRLPAFPVEDRRGRALRRAMFGPDPTAGGLACTCPSQLGRDAARSLPRDLQDELLKAGGGDSSRLYDVLAEGGYETVVFVGYQRASSHFGMAAVPDRARVVLWPAALDTPELHLPVHDATLARPDVVVVFSETERSVLEGRAGRVPAVLPFTLRVNRLALQTEPHGYDRDHRYLIVSADWGTTALPSHVRDWAHDIERDFAGSCLRVRLVGPGAVRLNANGGVHLTDSRTDVWRWMSRAVAVLEFRRGLILGREVIESMLCNTPVLVVADGGAAREHAERSHGGLWFRAYDELTACIDALLDGDVRAPLAEQASAYAVERFDDPAGFVEVVTETVLA